MWRFGWSICLKSTPFQVLDSKEACLEIWQLLTRHPTTSFLTSHFVFNTDLKPCATVIHWQAERLPQPAALIQHRDSGHGPSGLSDPSATSRLQHCAERNTISRRSSRGSSPGRQRRQVPNNQSTIVAVSFHSQQNEETHFFFFPLAWFLVTNGRWRGRTNVLQCYQRDNIR